MSVSRFVHLLRTESTTVAIKKAFKYLLVNNPVLSWGLFARVWNSVKLYDSRIFFSCETLRILPKSTHLPHPVGIVIAASTELGENVEIRQNVTIGQRKGKSEGGTPTIMDNVTIYAGAVLLGEITIGENAVIGANSVVLDDVEPNSTVVGAPATDTNTQNS
ncbi:serine O-acetyltransferase [Haloarcula laminariae]|uniref:serine O-acetyltransferase n=1 Tax=Haloarcula laminariae TaxID=2961577 RepID=UPI0024065751|nr:MULTISPECIES: serine acetyltransferase [Halomicroarcula]